MLWCGSTFICYARTQWVPPLWKLESFWEIFLKCFFEDFFLSYFIFPFFLTILSRQLPSPPPPNLLPLTSHIIRLFHSPRCCLAGVIYLPSQGHSPSLQKDFSFCHTVTFSNTTPVRILGDFTIPIDDPFKILGLVYRLP